MDVQDGKTGWIISTELDFLKRTDSVIGKLGLTESYSGLLVENQKASSYVINIE